MKTVRKPGNPTRSGPTAIAVVKLHEARFLTVLIIFMARYMNDPLLFLEHWKSLFIYSAGEICRKTNSEIKKCKFN